MATFLEAVESIALPCTLVILLPSIALLFAARTRRLLGVGSYVVGTSVLMWARAGRIWGIESAGVVIFLIAAVIVGSFVMAATAADRNSRRVAIAGLLGGAVAGWLWEPCVGTRFGDVLNNAETDRLWALAGMHLYVVGALLPAIMLAVLPDAVPRAQKLFRHRLVRHAGLGLGLVYAATVAIGRYDDLVAKLFRLSSS